METETEQHKDTATSVHPPSVLHTKSFLHFNTASVKALKIFLVLLLLSFLLLITAIKNILVIGQDFAFSNPNLAEIMYSFLEQDGDNLPQNVCVFCDGFEKKSL